MKTKINIYQFQTALATAARGSKARGVHVLDVAYFLNKNKIRQALKDVKSMPSLAQWITCANIAREAINKAMGSK